MESFRIFAEIDSDLTPESTAHVKKHRGTPSRGTQIVFVSLLLAVLYLMAPSPTQALTVFSGGECKVITQANGVRLDFCKNLTNKTVDDIHVTFSHPGLPNVLVEYGQSLACTVFGIGKCFGPAVAPNGNWNGSNGGTGAVSNILLWDQNDLIGVNVNLDRVTATGYWTKGGVAIPEPDTWALLIAGFAMVGAALRSHRHRQAAGAAAG